MDSELQLLVQELKLKVLSLLKEKEDIANALQTMHNELELLQTEVKEQKITIKELKEQNKIIKIADALGNPNEVNKEMIQTINHYLREIDECIRLISDSKL